MYRNKLTFLVAMAAFIGLLATSPSKVRAQASKSGSRVKASQSTTNNNTNADSTYDWKASFAKDELVAKKFGLTGKVPRMANGKPDLEGIWSRTTLTPQEPRDGQEPVLTASEAEQAENEAQQSQINLRVEPTVTPLGQKTTDAYNAFWRDGYWFKIPLIPIHASQVVDPPDGHVPPLTAAAKERRAEDFAKLERPATGPEDRPDSSRCIHAEGTGPAYGGSGPGGQESTLEITQSPNVVIVRTESLESQMIYLDGRPRPPEDVHLYLGASRGHWDGDTLVVDTTNFTADGPRGGDAQMHLTERWRRLDDTHMLYGYTIDDPGTWTKPWSIEYVMWRLPNQEELVEYACHEGNVGLEFTLSAARSQEYKERAKKQQTNN